MNESVMGFCFFFPAPLNREEGSAKNLKSGDVVAVLARKLVV
jgi:hypothetical protein